MRKTFLTFIVLCLSCASARAQVDNYCIRLSNGGSVDCGAMPELDESAYTIQFWMKPETWKNGAVILSRGDGFKIQTPDDNTIGIVAGGNTLTAKRPDLIDAGKWTQFTFIYDAKNMRIFVNGEKVSTKTGNFTLSADDAPFIIGGGFDGCIDELRVWNAELSSEFNYFLNNTINKYVPQLDNLVAYYKFDQDQCPNIVDYKALFKPGEYNHHGVISGSVQREIVTDNTGLPYLKCGAYWENNKFYWGRGNREQYLLANDIIILGINMYEDGHLEYRTPNNHATLVNASWLRSYQGRSGVVSLKGNGSKLQCTTGTLKANSDFTFETWIYLEKWTEGAYIFRKETADQKNGLAIYLGSEDTKQIIVRCNGKKYVNTGKMKVGEWVHFGITSNNGGTTRNTFLFSFNGTEGWATASLSDGGTDPKPTGMAGEIAYIGENLEAKLDNTTIWSKTSTLNDIKGRMTSQPLPAISGQWIKEQMDNALAFYKYDKADNPGHSTYSQDEIKNLIEDCFEGYRGYQLRIAVYGHKNWINIISNNNTGPASRKRFAEDLARLSEGYAGVELDLEWMYTKPQTFLRILADDILAVLPKDKTLHISVHCLANAYFYPAWHMPNIDGFTAQIYGGDQRNYYYKIFENAYRAMKDWGYPNEKMYMSYGTTTSSGTGGAAITGYNRLDFSNYKANRDTIETGKQGNATYYFCGPYQTYLRAKFCVENNLEGIFYWDMVNDFHPTTAANNYSLAKYCNYGLACNVDTLVTEVDVRHITTAIKRVNSDASQELQIRYNASELTFSAANISDNEVAGIEIFTATGVKICEAKAAAVSAKSLPAGVYLVRARQRNGQITSQTIIKK
ncbi:MAG: T9SS type A sorting domain-containing protein [Prevotella sp.]|nr:T9SS type A sorting domain-containing protein [Prevotella sp.]